MVQTTLGAGEKQIGFKAILTSMGKKNCSELLGELKCWLKTLEEHPVDGAER